MYNNYKMSYNTFTIIMTIYYKEIKYYMIWLLN